MELKTYPDTIELNKVDCQHLEMIKDKAYQFDDYKYYLREMRENVEKNLSKEKKDNVAEYHGFTVNRNYKAVQEQKNYLETDART